MKQIIIPILAAACMCACRTPQKTAAISPDAALEKAKENSETNAMLLNGTDFYARGNSPANWTLDMNYDDTIRFVAQDGLALKFAFNQMKKEISAGHSVFSVNTRGGSVSIDVTDGTCTVPTIRKVFSKLVSFTFNGKTYTGCGDFLADHNLNNKWVLDKIGNTFIQPGDYNRLPVLQFDLDKQRVSGNDGCNTIGGKIEVQGNRIKFSAMISTKMACMKKSIESIISAQISDKLVNYYFKKGQLYLYLPDDSLLVFKKVES